MNNAKRIALISLPPLFLGLFVAFTDPYKLPLPLLIIPFVLIGAGSYYAARELLRGTTVSSRKRAMTAGVVTSILLLAVLLQSIRQLSLKDFLIMAMLLAGITFYLRRLDI